MSEYYGSDDVYGEDDDEWLLAHPNEERLLWADWVESVCKQRGIEPPTSEEFFVLRQEWHHGKAPIDSVDRLERLRARNG